MERWYASEIFWTAATGIVAALIGAAAVWVTVRVANPRRRLLYSMPTVTPLLNDTKHDLAGANLEVRRAGKVLSDPHVLGIRLVSRSSRDIPSAAFEREQPIQFDVGAQIVEVLQVASSPETTRCPDWTFEGSLISIGPGLIKKGQRISLSILVDGARPKIACPYPTLVDVEVQSQNPEEGYPTRVFSLVLMVVLGINIAIMLLTLLWAAGPVVFGTAMLSLGLFGGVTVFFVMRHRANHS